jgi:glyoxylase-like metal-dependent hydrolase (beta-lactamase superfamily II)
LSAGQRSPWGRRALLALVALGLLGGGGWLWLTAREDVPVASDYTIDLGALRTLAGSRPGPKPARIRSALVAETSLPRAAVFAGEPFTPQPFVHQVFQVQWADGAFVLIDAGFTPELLEEMGGGTIHPEAHAGMLRALGGARAVVFTHEHFDHLSGVLGFRPWIDLAGRLRLTSEQLGNTQALDEGGFPEAQRRSLEPLVYERVLAIAPGVVLQKAPGHTPGSQLVYVQTWEGREYLFVGDVAWHLDQLTRLHYRPRLVTGFFLGEDRRAVLAQFRALYELMATNPDLAVVVSHDPDQRARLLASGALVDGLASD